MPKLRNPLSIKSRAAMVDAVRRAHQHVERQEIQEAKVVLEKVALEAAFAGVESADLSWGLAIVSDYSGELPEAFLHIIKAVKLDPLSPSIENSFGVICGRIRNALADSGRDLAEPTTPRLYKMLVQVGRCDEASHLAMARHLHHVNKGEDALRILDALTVVAPAFREGWELKATVLAKLGREGADEAAAEAEICMSGVAPLFAVPRAAQA